MPTTHTSSTGQTRGRPPFWWAGTSGRVAALAVPKLRALADLPPMRLRGSSSEQTPGLTHGASESDVDSGHHRHVRRRDQKYMCYRYARSQRLLRCWWDALWSSGQAVNFSLVRRVPGRGGRHAPCGKAAHVFITISGLGSVPMQHFTLTVHKSCQEPAGALRETLYHIPLPRVSSSPHITPIYIALGIV